MSKESIEGQTIAIYGATSKIGSETAKKALDNGAEIVAFVRNRQKAEPLRQNGAEIIVGDITKRDEVNNAIKDKSIDATINFTADFNLSSNASRSRTVNVNGEENVLYATENNNVPRHIFISTIGIFMEGPNAYRDTKLEAEELVRSSDVPEWIILRLANVIGAEDPNDQWNNPFFTKDIAGKKFGISKIPGKKNVPFPFLGIETATNATLEALSANSKQTITVLDGYTTIDEYLTTMAKMNNIDHHLTIPSNLAIPALVIANRIFELIGKDFPITPGAEKLIVEPVILENQVMQRELNITPQSFEEVVYNKE